jgi:transcriptional regulator with XRE-family HTH domain
VNDTLDKVRDRLMKPPNGMTQKAWLEEVARETGVRFGTLRHIAEGRTTDPRMSTLHGLAAYLCRPAAADSLATS